MMRVTICIGRFVAACFAAASIASASHAATLFFDFGDTAQPTAGNYNNVDQTQAPILNAIDSLGAPTGIGLTTSGFNPGSNQSGTTTPSGAAAIFDGQATRDNLFGHGQVFGNTPPFPLGVLTLTGLDGSGATLYSFDFFSARIPATDNRETEYNITGANNGVAFLNSSANTSNIATVAGIKPTGAGVITINVDFGPNNNQANQFFYLGAMRMTSRGVPEPATGAIALAAAAATVGFRRRLAA